MLAVYFSSTRFSRAVTRQPVLECVVPSMSAVGVHIDDVTQLFTARVASKGKTSVLTIGKVFVSMMWSAGFTISSKSVVVSSDVAVATQLAATFQGEGVPMKAASACEDLVVAAAGGG